MRHRLLMLALLCLAPQLAAAQQAETIEYYAQDAIGSIRVVFNPAGTVLARQDYAPFGRQLFTVPAMPKEGFGGQEKDDETDQAYFHARMFQARTGRFTRPDPISGGLFSPQHWNRYAYALNNPVSVTDYSGLWPGGEDGPCSVEFPTGCSDPDIPRRPPPNGGDGCDGTIFLLVPGDCKPSDDPPGGDGDGGSGDDQEGKTPTKKPPPTTPPAPAPPAPAPDCPAVPLGPRTASLATNITEARMARAAYQGSTKSWFYDKVKNARCRAGDAQRNISWDYKQLGHEYEDFTNFNYGATGNAAGQSHLTLSLASLYAHTRAHGWGALAPSQLLNEAHDQIILWRGFQFVSKGCL